MAEEVEFGDGGAGKIRSFGIGLLLTIVTFGISRSLIRSPRRPSVRYSRLAFGCQPGWDRQNTYCRASLP